MTSKYLVVKCSEDDVTQKLVVLVGVILYLMNAEINGNRLPFLLPFGMEHNFLNI